MCQNHRFNDDNGLVNFYMTSFLSCLIFVNQPIVCSSLQAVYVYEFTVLAHNLPFNICYISPQLFSSDLSPQSSLKSHTWLLSTHTLLLHMNMFSGHIGWGSEKHTKIKFMNVIQLGKKTCAGRAGSLPGRVQLVKSMSSMAI